MFTTKRTIKTKIGDYVWSENPETGEKALKKVINTFVKEADKLIHINVAGEKIITTPEHPFYVPQKGWTSAVNLRAGEILVLRGGEYVTVEKIQHEILENPIKVYNFEVEDFHTYYVSDRDVLVHNMCYTNHGKYRAIGRGMTDKEYNLLKKASDVRYQSDGAKVYIRKVNGRYNYMVENSSGKVVTFLKGKTKKEISNLARNYGWFRK